MNATNTMDRIFSLTQELAGLQQQRGDLEPYRTQYIRYVGELEGTLTRVLKIADDTVRELIERKLEQIEQAFKDDIAEIVKEIS